MAYGFNLKNGKETLNRYDARTERTRYDDLYRSLCRATARVARESQINAGRTCRQNWRSRNRRFELGNGGQLADRRQVACDRRSLKGLGAQSFAQRLEENFFSFSGISRLTIFQFCCTTYSVKSDGVRPKISTARGGAAFLRVRDVVAGFFTPLSVESTVGRSEFEVYRERAASPPNA